MSTTNEYLEEEETEKNEDDKHAQGPHFFRGIKLAPYGQGARILWVNLYDHGDAADLMACILIWILIELQKEFDAVSKDETGRVTTDLETAWFHAKTNLLDRCSGSPAIKKVVRGKVLQFMEKFAPKKADLIHAKEVASDILDEADLADLDTKGEGSGGK